MENTIQARARSLPPPSIATSKATDTLKVTEAAKVIEIPAVTRPISQSPPRKTPAKAASESPKLSKKRPISETEPADAKAQQQTKKSRKEDASSVKPGAQSSEDATRRPATDKVSMPVVTKQKDTKLEIKTTKARKDELYHTSPGNVGAQLGALDGAIRATGKSSDPRWSAVGHTQEDSHDFLQYLLGTFEKAKGVHKDQFASLFRIKHKISWTCDGCKKVHTHSDPPGFSLSLPIPKVSGTVNLTNCLDTYHREPNVIIRCDKCKKNVKRTRIFQLDNAPDVLPIQLMRFGYGPRGSTKNKQHVDYPDELDLSPWAVDRVKPSKYRLQAIVAHSGSLKFGHYIAYVRSADGIKEISDSSVQNSSAKEWRRPTSGFDPYILVYIKQ
ncbi:cysteine proteinase [Aureobasidium subglaciale]|nr:cysteine proteinase [Aureobasidium subglaciale]